MKINFVLVVISFLLLEKDFVSGQQTTSENKDEQHKKRFHLSDFNKKPFWQSPPDGMFEVDIGLLDINQKLNMKGKVQNDSKFQDTLPDLQGQNLMQFADINSDMFTDIITTDNTRQNIIIHIFDPIASNFSQKISFKPTDCEIITNVAVGRANKALRLFVTCEDSSKHTVIRMYDRNMNSELVDDRQQLNEETRQNDSRHLSNEQNKAEPEVTDKTVQQIKDLSSQLKNQIKDLSEDGGKLMRKIIGNNNMVFKIGNIHSLNFIEVPEIINIDKGSQPFIGDINGDQIDDILFNNPDDSATTKNGRLNVGIFNLNTNKYEIGNFRDLMVDPNCGGVQSLIKSPILSTPHSVSMVDLDGDCMADLFLTLVDEANPERKFYEIFLRREYENRNKSGSTKIDGLHSLCLVQFEEISGIPNNQIFNFADVDRDGMIDLLFLTDKRSMNLVVSYNMLQGAQLSPFGKKQTGQDESFASQLKTRLNEDEGQLNITDPDQLLNKQQELKNKYGHSKMSLCHPPNRPIEKVSKIFPKIATVLNSLVSRQDNTYHAVDKLEEIESKHVFNTLLSSSPEAAETFQEIKSTKNQLWPRIYIGDIDSDGYPDILVTIRYQNGSSIPHVLLNKQIPKTKTITSGLSDLDFRRIDKETPEERNLYVKNRYFDLNVTANEYHRVLYRYKNARFAVFTDMIENSMLDLMIVSQPDTFQKGALTQSLLDQGITIMNEISPVYNNLHGESFFIKARMLTDDRLGTPVRAATFKAVLTSLDDDKFIVSGQDSGQMAFGALQVPNCMIGVGRSNNFVEMFTVAIFEEGKRQTREWSPIIPKSVLYVYSNLEQNPMKWQLSLLVNPTSKINLIFIVDFVLLLIIGLVIIVLYFREKVEDEKEQVDAFNYF